MEADVLPVSAVLVAGPDSAKTLCGCPAVQGDNVRTLAYAFGYDIVSSLGTVQSEVIAVAYPCNISLQGGDSANFYLFLEIAKQMPGGCYCWNPGSDCSVSKDLSAGPCSVRIP